MFQKMWTRMGATKDPVVTNNMLFANASTKSVTINNTNVIPDKWFDVTSMGIWSIRKSTDPIQAL